MHLGLRPAPFGRTGFGHAGVDTQAIANRSCIQGPRMGGSPYLCEIILKLLLPPRGTPPLGLGEIRISESPSPTWGGSSLQWRDWLPSCHQSLKGYWPLPRKWPRPPSSSLGNGVLTSVRVDICPSDSGVQFPLPAQEFHRKREMLLVQKVLRKPSGPQDPATSGWDYDS